MRNQRMCTIVIVTAGIAASSGVWAQSLRDPTLPPAALAAPGGGSRPNPGRTQTPQKSLSIIVVDGQHRLVVGSRLYAQGQKLGDVQIERITETQVWLRHGRELRKVSVFAGIQRHVIEPADEVQPCAPSASAAGGSAPTPAPALACDRGPL